MHYGFSAALLKTGFEVLELAPNFRELRPKTNTNETATNYTIITKGLVLDTINSCIYTDIINAQS